MSLNLERKRAVLTMSRGSSKVICAFALLFQGNNRPTTFKSNHFLSHFKIGNLITSVYLWQETSTSASLPPDSFELWRSDELDPDTKPVSDLTAQPRAK